MSAQGWTAAILEALERPGAALRLLERGENETYLVTERGRPACVVRRYRPGRWTIDEVRAELAWIDRLADRIPVARPRRLRGDAPLLVLEDTAAPTIAAAFEYIDGDAVTAVEPAAWQRLGALLRELHRAAAALQAPPSDWPGWRRPHHQLDDVADRGLRRLARHLPPSVDRGRLDRLSAALRERCAGPAAPPVFLHMDLHLGNVLERRQRWYVLDFDECAFGPPELDVGVARLHMHAAGRVDALWPPFAAGYGAALRRLRVHRGTAVRIAYMLGKLPDRLDIDAVRRAYGSIVDRNLRRIEDELARDAR